ncbi:MAG TPA: DUF2793 domain-containing protein [Rhizomicrobium sp.]|nr:DUF2793 domain-containing protein [Rhizomicrobium sp.]
MSDTPRASLPLLAAAQAQKHVTHNEALYQLDALTCANILDRDLSAPPASPADGDTYLVKATATGDWAGQTGNIAFCVDGGWRFYMPFAGLIAYVADESALIIYSGSSWLDFASMLSFNNIALLGINTTADSTNKFSAKSNAALFASVNISDGGSGDIRATLSKQSAAKTASFLFQDNFSGRAEIGITGDDDFHFKVSPDGSSWSDALKIASATGALTLLPGGLLGGGRLKSFQTFAAGGTWTKPSGIRFALAETIGGGGAGGSITGAGSAKGAGGGGGAGGYARELIDVSAISSQTVTVGSGGAASAGAAGGNGGTSSFGSLLSATGGSGGATMTAGTVAAVAAGGSGGAGSGGDLNLNGSPGGIAFVASATVGFSGAGAAGKFGGGGDSRTGTNAVGIAGNSPGSGGSGGLTNNATSRSGGAGADGIVVVWEFE